MSKMLLSLCVLSLYANLSADELILPQEAALPDAFEAQAAATATPMPLEALPIPAPAIAAPAPKPQKLPEVPFSPFTGKVKGKKVRLRLAADLDSQVVRELNKGETLAVIGEKDAFWAVEAPRGIKAYVFRSFVLDNVIEGNRVNVRLEPSLDAAIIAHLNAGDKISGTISAINSKWYEIATPASARFFVAKDLIEFAGGPEVKAQIDKRRNSAEQLLSTTSQLVTVELDKTFEKISIDQLSQNYKTLISDYSEFPDLVDKARESLTQLQESYLQKRIAFLETKATPALIEESIAASKEEEDAFAPQENATDKMKLWEPLEEALYLSWAQMNDSKGLDEYYDEQKLAAVAMTGIVEAYTSPVKNKPGDFIIRNKDLPIAYVYSTQVNLEALVGKKVTLLGTPRPNNNFAFPAYAVLTVE